MMRRSRTLIQKINKQIAICSLRSSSSITCIVCPFKRLLLPTAPKWSPTTFGVWIINRPIIVLTFCCPLSSNVFVQILYTRHTLSEDQIVRRSIIKIGWSSRNITWFNSVVNVKVFVFFFSFFLLLFFNCKRHVFIVGCF